MIALVILIVLSLIVALLVAGCRYRPTRIPASVALFLLVIALLWPAPRRAGEASRRMQCKWNLQTIGLALHNYHDAYGCFPPAYIADEDGQPMHSWRVLVLPYLEHATLYEQYRFDEPWDGPNNCELGDQICSSASIGSFRCPSDWTPSPLNTNYVLITGEGTAWEDEQSPRRNDFTDGTSQRSWWWKLQIPASTGWNRRT